MAFKSLNALEKNVELAIIEILSEKAKVKIELQSRFSVVKSYTLPFLEAESVKVGNMKAYKQPFCWMINHP